MRLIKGSFGAAFICSIITSPDLSAQADVSAPHRYRVATEFRYEVRKPESDDAGEVPSVAPAPYRLPPYYVREKELRLKERELLTEHGKLLYAKKRFLSPSYQKIFGPLSQLAGYYLNFLSLFGGWHPNDAEARVLMEQEERLERMRELSNLSRLESIGNGSIPPLAETKLSGTVPAEHALTGTGQVQTKMENANRIS